MNVTKEGHERCSVYLDSLLCEVRISLSNAVSKDVFEDENWKREVTQITADNSVVIQTQVRSFIFT